MSQYLSKSILLLLFSVVLCCVIYPLAVWVVGQTFFPFQANGSLLKGPDGKPVGSKLIAQPFTRDEYFQSRPSAASYDASASASSSLAASNYALRDRAARALGPIAKYQSGPKAGQLAALDIENWFRQDMFQGNPHIVAQWAHLHTALAQAWVKADPTHGAYVDDWAKTHPDLLLRFIKEYAGIPKPKAADLAIVFFKNFSEEHPGRFPSTTTHTGADGKTETVIEPVNDGSDIQSIFFDMWRQDHPEADLAEVPGDLVTTSGSGLDPHITLQNAESQLDRVVSKWADNTKRDPAVVRREIERIFQKNVSAPLGGLAGEKFINVLEVNLELCKLYGAPS
jgi:potassium-transporting ATPase KdpC subunit